MIKLLGTCYENMKVLCMYGVMWVVIRRTVAGVLRNSVSVWLALLQEQNCSLAAKQWAIAHNGSQLGFCCEGLNNRAKVLLGIWAIKYLKC